MSIDGFGAQAKQKKLILGAAYIFQTEEAMGEEVDPKKLSSIGRLIR
jgi:hypothetical protein